MATKNKPFPSRQYHDVGGCLPGGKEMRRIHALGVVKVSNVHEFLRVSYFDISP